MIQNIIDFFASEKGIKIIDFFSNDNFIKIVGFIFTILTSFIVAKVTSNNTKKSLTTQYFKEKGVNIQEKVLNFWSGLFMNGFQIKQAYEDVNNNSNNKSKDKKNQLSDIDIIKEIHRDSYAYCSSKTIRAISDYQQYSYRNNNNSNSKNVNDTKETKIIKIFMKKLNAFRMFILISRIIKRMKYDFTGENVDELDIIKIKINDFGFLSQILARLVLYYYNIKEIISKLIFKLILIIIIILIIKKCILLFF